MFLKDIHTIKVEMEKKIPKSRIETAFTRASALFAKSKDE
jgi:hypothetical protein